MATRKIHALLNEYGESHKNHTNKTIHWICVPLIVMSVIGLFWSIPVPPVFEEIGNGWLNWGTIFVGLAFLYYIVLSIPLTLGMVFVAGGMVVGNYLIAASPAPIWLVSVIIFVAAWIGQFIGHNIEGKKPSFLKDVQFLMIGPLWLLSFIYRRAGIKY